MICKFCGFQMDDDANFCTACGAAAKDSEIQKAPGAESETPVSQPQPAEDKTAAVQNTENVTTEPKNAEPAAPKTPVPQAPVGNEKTKKTKNDKKPKKKKSVGVKILIAFVALFLALVILVGVVIGVVVGIINSNPTVKLAKAVNKTFFNSETVAIDAELTDDDEKIFSIKTEVDYGDNLEDTDFSLKYTNKNGKSYRLKLEDGEYTDFNGDKYDISGFCDDLEDVLSDEGIDLDVDDLLDRVINEKLDAIEMVKVYTEEIAPELADYDNHSFLVDTASLDYESYGKGLVEYMMNEMPDDILTYEKVRSSKGQTYEYNIKFSELYECFYEYTVDSEEFNEFIDAYVEAYWEAYGETYLKWGIYDSRSDMKRKILESFENSVEEIVEEDIEFQGRFTIVSGRLTYFSFEYKEILFQMDIESEK